MSNSFKLRPALHHQIQSNGFNIKSVTLGRNQDKKKTKKPSKLQIFPLTDGLR